MGYRVYVGGSSRVYTNVVEAGNATATAVNGLDPGRRYYFAATAYDTAGMESAYSAEVSYTVPPGTTTTPGVVLSAPANGAIYTAPANVSLAASVTPNGNTITKVQFYNGSALLGEDTASPYTLPWNNVSSGTYSLTARAVYGSGSTVSSSAVSVTVNPSAPTGGLTFAASSGAISSPFVVSNGFVYQSTETGVTTGGRAAYTFSVPSAGTYVVSAVVNAATDPANSFYVNIDAEPTDPAMIWDIPIGSGFVSRTVSWRGNGTYAANEFTPKVFSLTAGTHQLIVRGREANTYLGTLTISPTGGTPPQVALTAPADGASYTAPATISLAANVTPNGHTISKVQFFNGSTLLGEDTTTPYTFAWNNVSAGIFSLTAWIVYDSGSTVGSSDVSVTVNPSAPSGGLTFAASSGAISSPFVVSNGFVYQRTETGVTTGGRAAYAFSVPSAGTYVVSAVVSATADPANSFYVNIDAEPTDPGMIWDIPIASGFVNRTVSWRGNGTYAANEFTPKVFSLTAGTHQLIVRGREANTYLGTLTISPTGSSPPAVALTAPSSGGTYTAPASISLAASVTPNGNTITKVQFYNESVLLGEDSTSPYTLAWNNVSAGTYNLTARAVYGSGSTVSSPAVSVTVNPSSSGGVTFAASSGTISSPFVVSNGFVYQRVETSVTTGGRAVYTFSVPSSGNYLVSAVVSATADPANSFYVNIDAEPTDPTMIWDIPIASGFNSRTVSWRGSGTYAVNQFTPKVFSLTAGAHQLIVRGREANTFLGTITISPAGSASPLAAKAPWALVDIGNSAPGNVSSDSGTYTISGAGALGSYSDAFAFLCQPMTEDGEITAQITGCKSTSPELRAGVMLRESLTAGSRYEFLGIGGDGTFYGQGRNSTSGSSSSSIGGSGAVPNTWVRLARSSGNYYAYTSADGLNWNLVNTSQTTMATGSYLGLAVASGLTNQLSTVTFTNITAVP